MYRAICGDLLLVGITEDNVRKILDAEPLYVKNDSLGLDFDIQIALENTLGIGIEGRKCLTNVFTKKTLDDLRKGAVRQIPKTEHTKIEVCIFYGKDMKKIQEWVNEAVGRDKPVVEVAPDEYYMERVENGQAVVERGKVPASIFRSGTEPPNVF